MKALLTVFFLSQDYNITRLHFILEYRLVMCLCACITPTDNLLASFVHFLFKQYVFCLTYFAS